MKTVVLLVVLILSGGMTFGQENEPAKEREMNHEKFKNMTAEEKAKHKTEKMDEVLDLSDDQSEKINAINLETATELDAIHKEMEALKAKAKSIKEKSKEQVEEVLTDEQKVKMEEEQEKMKQKHEKMRREKCCEEKH